MRKVKVSGAIVYLMVLLVAILLYVVYILNPMLAKNTELNTQNAADAQLISDYTVQMATLNNLKAGITELNEKVKDATKSSDFSSVEVWNDVNSGLAKTGVVTQSASVGDGSEVKDAKLSASGKKKMSVDVTLTMDCTEPQLEKLIHYFEKESKGVYYVNAVQMTKLDSKTPGQQKYPYNVSIAMTMYYYLTPAKKAASSAVATSASASAK